MLPVVLQSGESVHVLGQQDDDHGVVVEVGLAAEGVRVDAVEVLIEECADLGDVALREAGRRIIVEIDRHAARRRSAPLP